MSDAVGKLATAHEEWDERWKDAATRAAWLEPEPLVLALAERLRERGLARVLDLGCGVDAMRTIWPSRVFSASASTPASRGLPTRASVRRRSRDQRRLSCGHLLRAAVRGPQL